MIEYVKDFAVHHYFLMGFISLCVLTACIKGYTSLNENIDYKYRVSHSSELSKKRRK